MKTVYRILNPVICIVTIPIALFVPFVRLVITSSLSTNIMQTFGIREYSSLYDLIKLLTNANESSSQLVKVIYQIFTAEDSKISEMLTTTPYLIASVVLLAVILITMLAAAVLSIMNKSGTVTIMSGVCVILSIAMKNCFAAFAKPFLTGQIGLKSLLSSGEQNILTSLIGNAAKVSCFEMSFVYQSMLLICAAAAIFSLFAYFDKKYN